MLNNLNNITLENVANIFQEYTVKLQQELNRYIPEIVELCKYDWAKNTFSVNDHEVGDDMNGFQEDIFDIQVN